MPRECFRATCRPPLSLSSYPLLVASFMHSVWRCVYRLYKSKPGKQNRQFKMNLTGCAVNYMRLHTLVYSLFTHTLTLAMIHHVILLICVLEICRGCGGDGGKSNSSIERCVTRKILCIKTQYSFDTHVMAWHIYT